MLLEPTQTTCNGAYREPGRTTKLNENQSKSTNAHVMHINSTQQDWMIMRTCRAVTFFMDVQRCLNVSVMKACSLNGEKSYLLLLRSRKQYLPRYTFSGKSSLIVFLSFSPLLGVRHQHGEADDSLAFAVHRNAH